MLKMPIPSRWRSISVVLPLLFSAGPLLAPAPLLARSPETAAILETMESGSVSRSAVEALLARANAGDTEAAEVAGRLYDCGVGVKWDPPSALRWYATAALAGSDSAKREAIRLWKIMPPVSQRRAEALLASFFTDAELASINIGPVRRPTNQRSWMTHLEAAGFLAPLPPAPTPSATVPLAVPATAVVPAPVPAPGPGPGPTPLPKPAMIQPVSAIAAAPAPPLATPSPAASLPAAPLTATPPAPGTNIPRPPRKPHQMVGAKTPIVLPASHIPVPSAKPKPR
jgi:hypothetical protein